MSDDDCHRRTAITRLDVSPADESLLRDTIEAWKQGCQIAVDRAWERCHSKSDVQELAYDDVREQTSLASQHAILACHQAAENIKSCISRRQDGQKASKLTYTSPTVTYDSRTMTVFPEKEHVSLTTHGDHSRGRADRGIEFVLSTDAHTPGAIAPRVEALEDRVAERGLATTTVVD